MNEPEDHLRGVGLHGLGFIAARGNLLVQIVARVARGSVDVRALRERIVVAVGSAQALNFGLLTCFGRIIAVFKISIADGKHAEAAAERA